MNPDRSTTLWSVCMLLAVLSPTCHAAADGMLEVRSAIGEPLIASVSVSDGTGDGKQPECVTAQIENLVGDVIDLAVIGITRRDQQWSMLLNSRDAIIEAVVNVWVQYGCTSVEKLRFQALLDLPEGAAASTAPGVHLAAGLPVAAAVAARSFPASRAGSGGDSAFMQSSPSLSDRIAPRLTKTEHLSTLKPFSSRDVLKMAAVEADAPVRGIAGGANGSSISNLSVPQLAMAARTDALVRESMRLSTSLGKGIEVSDIQNGNTDRYAPTTAQPHDYKEGHSMFSIQIFGIALVGMCIGIIWLAWRMRGMERAFRGSDWHKTVADAMAVKQNAPAIRVNPNLKVDKDNELDTTLCKTSGDTDPQLKKDDAWEKARKKTLAGGREEECDVPIHFDPPGPYRYNGKEAVAEEQDDAGARDFPVTVTSPATAPDVEEMVEVWMALHEPIKVIDMLSTYHDVQRPDSPLPWLCLLDVYKTLDAKIQYDAIQSRIQLMFNVKVPRWESRFETQEPKSLGHYPHLMATILRLWHSDDVAAYVDNLIVNGRKNIRDGFEIRMYRDLLRLQQLVKDPQRPLDITELKSDQRYRLLFQVPHCEQRTRQKSTAMLPDEDVSFAETKRDSSCRPARVSVQFNGNPVALRDEITAHAKTIAVDSDGKSSVPEEADVNLVCSSRIWKTSGWGVNSAGLTGARAGRPLTTDAAKESRLPASRDAATESNPAKRTIDTGLSPMGVQIELATAYRDIGEMEGAVLLLKEVVKLGDADECADAKKLLLEFESALAEAND